MNKIYTNTKNRDHYKWIRNTTFSTLATSADIVCFSSSDENINAELYKEKPISGSEFKNYEDQTDLIIYKAIERKRKMEEAQYPYGFSERPLLIGMGRGAHFLTVMAGGKIIQDVSNHTLAGHYITTREEDFYARGVHNQMMYPFDVKGAQILAWARVDLSSVYLDGDKKSYKLPSNFKEPEIVYYPNIHALAIQPNKIVDKTDPQFVNYLNSLIDVYTRKYRAKVIFK